MEKIGSALSKKLIPLSVIILAIFSIFLINFPLACDYENHAWGDIKRTCTCIGLKTLTSHGHKDEGISYDCIGISMSNKCYTEKGNYSVFLGINTVVKNIVVNRRLIKSNV